MAGFDFSLGRSNNMIAAEARGMITIGRWAKQYGVSAAAADEVMAPAEAHHTGTGRRGKSRLTPVIDADLEPTTEQLAAMKAFDAAVKAAKEAPPKIITDCIARWLQFHPYARTGRGRRPDERIEKIATCELHVDGTIECVDLHGHRTVNWQKLGGLVIAKAGLVIAENVNPRYDDAAAIALRIAPAAEDANV